VRTASAASRMAAENVLFRFETEPQPGLLAPVSKDTFALFRIVRRGHSAGMLVR
jgi:hypothetical protein